MTITEATLVAFYGEKSPRLEAWLLALQREIESIAGPAFEPHALGRIHATVIGLEAFSGDPRTGAAQRAMPRRDFPSMDLAGFLGWLRESRHLPFTVQLGGFEDRPYPFESRAQRPFERMFSIQRDLAVLIGWPIEAPEEAAHPRAIDAPNERGGPRFPMTLERLRRGAGRFGITHRYHTSYVDCDNDLYLRIGVLDRSRLGETRRRDIESIVRRRLSETEPLRVTIDAQALSVVSYVDPSLPPETSQVHPLREIDLESDLSALFHTTVR